MNVTLKDIATISTGLTFRSAVQASDQGNLRLIQMKDLGSDNRVHLAEAVYINVSKINENQYAQKHDLIFRSRGATNTAVLLADDVDNVVISAPLFRVRVTGNKTIAEYLLWWINQPLSQKYFARYAEGSILQMVSKQHLEDLPVTLPPMAQQRKIATLHDLLIQEQALLDRLKSRKMLYMQEILVQMASEPYNK